MVSQQKIKPPKPQLDIFVSLDSRLILSFQPFCAIPLSKKQSNGIKENNHS